MKKIICLFCAVLFLLPSIPAQARSAHHRALFVSVIQGPPVLTSRSAIIELAEFAKKSKSDTIFIQIVRSNKTWFKSEVGDSSFYEAALKSVGEDPLALLIREAHARGIEVHAWVNLLSLSDNAEAPLIKKYGPGILTRNLEPKKTIRDFLIDNQFWLEPGDLRVREEMKSMTVEILSQYPELDGYQLDYIRYPDSKPHYGYNTGNMERFKKAAGLEVIDDQSEVWKNWKRDQVTELVRLLRETALALNPKIVFTTTGCAPYVRAREEAFQDWAVWLETGLADFVTMMSYPPNVETFEKYIGIAKKKTGPLFSKVNVALPAYKLVQQPEIFNEQWEMCEKSGARGCVVFHYGSLIENPEMKKPLLRKGFLRRIADFFLNKPIWQ